MEDWSFELKMSNLGMIVAIYLPLSLILGSIVFTIYTGFSLRNTLPAAIGVLQLIIGIFREKKIERKSGKLYIHSKYGKSRDVSNELHALVNRKYLQFGRVSIQLTMIKDHKKLLELLGDENIVHKP